MFSNRHNANKYRKKHAGNIQNGTQYRSQFQNVLKKCEKCHKYLQWQPNTETMQIFEMQKI